MLIAQLSDPHLRPPGEPLSGRVETYEFLQRAVDAVLALEPLPDLVAITGDLSDRGRAQEYALLAAELERLPMPVHVIPGNHDHRETLRRTLPESFYPRATPTFIQFAADLGPLRLIFLDTLDQGQEWGALCPIRLAWVEAELAAAQDRPVVMLMHHPPFRCGIPFMDEIRLLKGEAELGRLVDGHPRIEGILCGHVHRPVRGRWHGRPAQIAPSTAHQITLETRPMVPSSFVLEPPAFLLHRWNEPAGLVTHQACIDEFPGPFPFAHDPGYPPQD